MVSTPGFDRFTLQQGSLFKEDLNNGPAMVLRLMHLSVLDENRYSCLKCTSIGFAFKQLMFLSLLPACAGVLTVSKKAWRSHHTPTG